MFYANINETFSLLLSIRYTYNKHQTYDYTKLPRPCHNFVFIIEGKGKLQTADNIISINPGDILFIPKNTTYLLQWQANPNVVFQSLHFSLNPQHDIFFNKNLPIQLLNNADFESNYLLVKNIEKYQFSKDINSFFILSNFYQLCGNILKSAYTFPNKQVTKSIIPAISYIENNYLKPISIEHLASLCFISPSRFHFLFKQQIGVSPIVYKNQILIQHAAQELLRNKDESIANISKHYNFSNVIYFERLFKKIMGKSPSQYKKENIL